VTVALLFTVLAGHAGSLWLSEKEDNHILSVIYGLLIPSVLWVLFIGYMDVLYAPE
jgi:hypothetical protein